MAQASTAAAAASRIPTTLQAVFLASNRGNEVNKPPPERAAFKEFISKTAFWLTARGGQRHHSAAPTPPQPSKQNNRATPSRHLNAAAAVVNNKPPTTQRIVAPPLAPPQEVLVPVKQQDDDENKAPSSSPRSQLTRGFSSTQSLSLSPQALLDAMIGRRGYASDRFKTLQTAYYNKPTDLQRASYDRYLIQLVRQKEYAKFQAILQSGISPNPCNDFGESLVHTVCRLGDVKFLQILLDEGCTLQVADDYGRTPLHDACWSAQPNFDVIELILNVDKRLFHMTDARGSVPLSYVHKDHWPAWVEFLDKKKHIYWPQRENNGCKEAPPALALLGPNTKPIPDPAPRALPVNLAAMVASGRMIPQEAELLMTMKIKGGSSSGGMTAATEVDEEESDDSDYDESQDDYSSDYDSDDYDYDSSDDESAFDEEEMSSILNTLSHKRPGAGGISF